jgi:hypothetical protein
VQPQHQQPIIGLSPIHRLLDRAADARTIGLERILEWTRMAEQRLAAGLMHGIIGSPEPQIGLGQRGVQRLGGRYRNQTLLVGAAEENGDPHSSLSFWSCSRRSREMTS